MSYQVLARKWRPQNFKQMVGQEHVLRALINALESDRLHHAYLFTGTRGVGKTTIARILAKCFNCEKGVTSEPCGTCSSCEEIAAGNFVDLIEVDAASRTKVEDTRELLENVQYAPTRARYKVYLIDEVHMLTGHSFNALLKTLEEPPPHVKFLFATTDPQKLPATILSRCLQFNLKRMPVDLISGHLQYLLDQESIAFEELSLKLIARAADGSMRDGLSLLDQSIAYCGDKLTEDSVRDMLGSISNEPLIDLIRLVAAGKGAELLNQIEDLSGVIPDYEAATDAMIALLHQLAVQQVVPNSVHEDNKLVDLAKSISKEDVQLYYQIALQGRRDLPLSPDPRSGFEMLLLRMMSFRPLQQGMKLQSLSSDTSIAEQGQAKKKILKSDISETAESISDVVDKDDGDIKQVHENEPPPWNEATTEDINSEKSTLQADQTHHAANTHTDTNILWHELVPLLKLNGRAAELIKHCVLENQENGIILLTLDSNSEDLLADSVHKEIEKALVEYHGFDLKLNIQIAESEHEDLVALSIQKETPAQRSTREKSDLLAQAEENIATDPFVIELKNRFGAQIVPGSIQVK